MAVYAIGDVQGCFTELEQLLKKIRFNPNNDRLWLVGDLVNYVPQSIETVQFVQSLGERAQCVLGNHDIHLIACAVQLRNRTQTKPQAIAAAKTQETRVRACRPMRPSSWTSSSSL